MTEVLVCPETRLPLTETSLVHAESEVGSVFVVRPAGSVAPIGRTHKVLLRADGACAYPVLDGIPILLVPERLERADLPNRLRHTVDISDRPYAEAYQEMAHYNAVAAESRTAMHRASLGPPFEQVLRLSQSDRYRFPEPRTIWLDAPYDCASQWDAYRHLAPLAGKCILQLGGKGTHAIKFLLAGAAEAWLLSPMLAELQYANSVAAVLDLEGRLHTVAGVAEEMPFRDRYFDGIYSGGCIHHTITGEAFAECARILRIGGRFSAVEPWRAPMYGIGTRLLGKREDAFCRPLTAERMSGFAAPFGVTEMISHGALSRYFLLALSKFGITLGINTVWGITKADDRLSSKVGRLRGAGSSVALLAAL